MWSNLPDYQSVAENIVTKIATQLINYQKKNHLILCWEKSDLSFVTPADYGVQYYLQKQLYQAFPHIPFVGEEVLLPKKDYKKIPEILKFVHKLDPCATEADLLYTFTTPQPASSLFWLADPIDGTAGFIRKRFFALALTLIYENFPVLSVLACPTSNQTFKIYSAAKNYGLSIFGPEIPERKTIYCKKKRTDRYCEASLAACNQQHHATRLLGLDLPGRPRPYRVESQYKYALVAEGFVDFFIRYPFISTRARTWDHAPGAFLVEEAGGVVTDLLGAPLDYSRQDFFLDNHPIILASGNQEIHETTLQALHSRLNTSLSTASSAS
ncbi:inositol monophosphatase family protein [Chlamydia sp. 17-3921]|uniref:inositol monophosphatase family protein n=1 Tax=Chlamydia sp. 17-3921 TaxID=2675798 RepID=UPI0019190003|nr:inositol monophosphatase family protein [Chlamydia sp. 17-3921]